MIASGFESLRAALILRTGHAYYADKDKLLRDRLRDRMLARGAPTLEHYAAVLDGAEGEAEWRALEDAITIGETYFFRYADHFDALRRSILPDLIARKSEQKALRIWSIGCANGAEPYSVAIVLRELLGEALGQWRISLVGGDISERALGSARAAQYGQWALRTLGPAERERYFTPIDARTWRLKPDYRAMVRFERQNILEILSPTGPLQWTDFDLILCRNVLIYFSTEEAIRLAAALRERLAPGGALLLGHAEATLAMAEPQLASAPIASEFVQALAPLRIEDWRPLLAPEADAHAVAAPVAPPAPVAQGMPTLDDVRRLADLGAYEDAQTLCKTLIETSPTSPVLHYFDAILSQVCDDKGGAEAALRRALYLDRSFALAHHRLGVLLLSSGRVHDGKRALNTAARLAAAQPADRALPEGHGVTAGVFADMVRHQLDALEFAA